MISRCCLCVCRCILVSLLGNGYGKSPLSLLGNGYVFYAVRVVSKESRRLVPPRIYCYLFMVYLTPLLYTQKI
jgi:hypothetical protein